MVFSLSKNTWSRSETRNEGRWDVPALEDEVEDIEIERDSADSGRTVVGMKHRAIVGRSGRLQGDRNRGLVLDRSLDDGGEGTAIVDGIGDGVTAAGTILVGATVGGSNGFLGFLIPRDALPAAGTGGGTDFLRLELPAAATEGSLECDPQRQQADPNPREHGPRSW
jgi:hypothetical protein